MKQEERRNFFNQIALRLRPNGYLVSSDVVSDLSTSAYQSLLTVWLRMMRTPEMSDEDIERIREKLSVAYNRDVAVLPSYEVASIILSSSFDPPVLFFQNLLIHAWFSRRTVLD